MNSEATIKEVMSAVLGIAAETISDETSMDNVEQWDSIKHMDLVLALEQEFGISIPDEDAANITSYRLIRLVLAEQLEGK